ncbi:MAG: hypothetical protein WC360_05570 [Opitutales bacterium]|jgi:hypothetical protein
MRRRAKHATGISVSLPAEMHEVLRLAALDDNRSVSSLVTALVDTYLRREGYLTKDVDFHREPLSRQTRLNLF